MEREEIPWGWYGVIDHGNRYKVKIIQVNPGQKLSLQRHYHRSEHWVVVEGVALVQIEDKETLIFENHSTYIPTNSLHRLSNPGKMPLKVIEGQSGSYL